MVKIIQDDIIYKLQSKGGISRYWSDLNSRLMVREDIDLYRINKDLNKIKYLLNFMPHIECVSTEKAIFHSSYYFAYKTKRIRSVVTVHDFMPEKYWAGVQKAKHMFMKRRAFSRSSRLVFINSHLIEEFFYFYPEYKNIDYDVIKHGNSFPISMYKKNIDKSLVYVGSIGEAKNFKFLIKYCQLRPDVTLKCIGITEKDIAAYSIKNSIDYKSNGNIQALGFLSDSIMKTVVADSSALIIPSIDEGFGLPAIEAICLGVPVIASRIPSFKELLVNDYLIDTKMFDESVDFIDMLVSSESLRKKVFEIQSSKISGLSWSESASSYIHTYKKVYDGF